jgi:hypothetical protein
MKMLKNRKMNRSLAILMAGLVLVTVSALFLVPRVVAASCFTDTSAHWAENFICWMKNHGLTSGYPDGTFKPDNMISRGEVSVFMQKIITTGDVYINAGPSNWVVNGTSVPNAYIRYYYGWTNLKTSSTGTYLYSISPSLPSSLYNTKMYVKGAKVCYQALEAGAYITSIEIYHLTYNTNPPDYFTQWNYVVDNTDLTDVGCRVIYFSSPSSFWGNDQVTLNLSVTFTDAASTVRVGVATLILTPSTEAAVLGHDDMVSPFVVAPTVSDPASGK